MQYMVIGTPKDSGSASDFISLTKKFQSSWQPPKGLTVDGLGHSGAHAYGLFSADDYTLVAEVMGQYAPVFNWTVEPVVATQDLAPAFMRGLEWATK